MNHIENMAELERLARIALSREERQLFSNQLEKLLAYFDMIKDVQIPDGCPPRMHPDNSSNVWDDDVPEEGFSIEEALQNAPATRANQIVVPQVVE